MQISISNAIGGGGGAQGGGTPSFTNVNSFSFDGVDDYFLGTSTYSELDGQNKATVSFWIKPPSTIVDLQVIASVTRNATTSNHQFQVRLATNGTVQISMDTNSKYIRASSTPLNLNAWNHVMFCFDTTQGTAANRGRVFINGADATSASAVSSTFQIAKGSLHIAKNQNAHYNNFEGLLDELAIWSGTDQRANVSEIYGGGQAVDLNNLATAPQPTTWSRMGDNATWNGKTWTMTDVNGGYTNRSINMVEANRTTDVPTASSFANTKSIALDGVDDYVNVADADNLSFGNGVTDSPFSISAWIKPVDSVKFRIVFKYNATTSLREYFFQVSTASKLQVGLYDASNGGSLSRDGNTTILENVWSHVAMTYNGNGSGNGIKIYLNGSLDNGSTGGGGSYTAMNNTNEPLLIGKFNGGTLADGLIDETAIFNTELSASDVTSIYNSGVPNDISSLSPLSWWRCGDGDTSPTLTDNGSASNNGTMTNFTTFSTDVPT